MAEFGLLLAGLGGLLFFCAVLVRWNECMFRGQGPPAGAVGWPLIGETIDLLMHGLDFVKIRRLRLCPGKELAMVQISVFLHYFVTRNRWEAIGKHKLNKFFKMEASKGLPYKIWDI